MSVWEDETADLRRVGRVCRSGPKKDQRPQQR
jgi:hypothetical protein